MSGKRSLLGGGGVVELAGVLPLLACLGEADLGVRAEAEGLLPAIDAVLAAPELATGRSDEQVQAVAVVEFPRLVADLRVLDFLDPEHLGVFSAWRYFMPPYIPPKV